MCFCEILVFPTSFLPFFFSSDSSSVCMNVAGGKFPQKPIKQISVFGWLTLFRVSYIRTLHIEYLLNAKQNIFTTWCTPLIANYKVQTRLSVLISQFVHASAFGRNMMMWFIWYVCLTSSPIIFPPRRRWWWFFSRGKKKQKEMKKDVAKCIHPSIRYAWFVTRVRLSSRTWKRRKMHVHHSYSDSPLKRPLSQTAIFDRLCQAI